MAHWLTFFRGLFAVTLGVAFIFRPDAARPLLGNFMGAFWFSSGLISIRWGLATKHARGLTIFIGIVGALAGLSMLGRNFVTRWVDSSFMLTSLGVVVLLTGILHVTGQMPVKHGPIKWTRSGLFLGIFEIFLGVVLIFADSIGPVINFVALIWAFLGGFVLIYDAWQMREEMKQGVEPADEKQEKTYENV